MAQKKAESEIRAEMYSRVQRLYIAFVLVGLIVIVRLLWVLFFSPEISTNAPYTHCVALFWHAMVSRWQHPYSVTA